MPGPIIEVRDVVKTFGKIKAVDHVSFAIMRGEIFAFLGPNGAGKSTTIKMLTTMLRPTSGELYLDGHDVTREQAKARQSFGIVFQDLSLDDDLTAFENMELHGVLYDVPDEVLSSEAHGQAQYARSRNYRGDVHTELPQRHDNGNSSTTSVLPFGDGV